MASATISCPKLYERGYYGWIRAQIDALRERHIEDIDFDNAAEQIEELGKSEKRSVQSHLETLLVHSLKLSYASGITRDHNARLWENTLELARPRTRKLLDESPSLGRHLEERFDEAYRAARILAWRALGFPREPLPETSPWTLGQATDDNFAPQPAS